MPQGDNPESYKALRPWVPGQSGNPAGRAKLTDIERAAREATRFEIAQVFQWLKDASDEKLEAVVDDPEQTQIAKWLASAIIHGKNTGDLTEFHRMADRLLGKPKEKVEHSGAIGSISAKSEEELNEQLARYTKAITEPGSDPS